MSLLQITNTKPNKPNKSTQNHNPLSQPAIICHNQSLHTKQKLHLKLIVYNSIWAISSNLAEKGLHWDLKEM